MFNQNLRYAILKTLRDTPEISQRGIAKKAGFSLGKVNECLSDLASKDMIRKIRRNGTQKSPRLINRYDYPVTQKGKDEQLRLGRDLLQKKKFLRKQLISEIEALENDLMQCEVSRKEGANAA